MSLRQLKPAELFYVYIIFLFYKLLPMRVLSQNYQEVVTIPT